MISMKKEATDGRDFDKMKQDRALPPSKHLAGSRFIAAKNRDEILNNLMSKGRGTTLKIRMESMFAKGPARHKTASFLYEQKRVSVSIIAPIMSKLIHFTLIFKNFANAKCPASCTIAALKIAAYFAKEKFFERIMATIIMIKVGDALILVFTESTPCA